MNKLEVLRNLGFKTLGEMEKDDKDNAIKLEEKKLNKLTINQVLPNFSELFPRSFQQDRFREIKNSGLENQFVVFRGVSVSETNPTKGYDTDLKFFKEDKDKKISTKTPMECKCSCFAFNFYSAYVFWKANSFMGRPKNAIKAPPVEKNPKQIPAYCKHLQGLANKLIRDGFIVG